MDHKWDQDYGAELVRRSKVFKIAKANPAAAHEYYKNNMLAWIKDWCWTSDTRRVGREQTIPFIPFPRQVELIQFFEDLIKHQVHGLVEKARDCGCSYVAVYVSLHRFIYFHESIGMGSNKADQLDRLGVIGTLLEKVRWQLRMLPDFMLNENFKNSRDAVHMKITDETNTCAITGEAGKNIGRGSRSALFLLDEAAHVENAEEISASLNDNTNVKVSVSSVCGRNLFWRQRVAGIDWSPDTGVVDDSRTQVFVFRWEDHPGKNAEWHSKRKKQAEAEGLLAWFGQEIERSYDSSTLGTLIKAEWVTACIGLKEDFPDVDFSGKMSGALDVADDSLEGDVNAISIYNGLEIIHLEEWGGIHVGKTALKAYGICLQNGVHDLNYDGIGVGSGIRGAIGNAQEAGTIPKTFNLITYKGSEKVENPNSYVSTPIAGNDDHGPKNKEFFMNRKSQSWFLTAQRFRQGWLLRNGEEYDATKLISLNRSIGQTTLNKLVGELSQAIRGDQPNSGKMIVNKMPPGTKSPNLADCVVIGCHPKKPPGTSYIIL